MDASGFQSAFAVIDDHHVAFLEAGAEGGDGAVFPHIHEDRFAGEDGGREADVEAGDRRVVIIGDRAENGAAAGAVGAQPVQDRRGEPGGGGEFRVRMQRVAVTGQPVEQRLISPGVHLDGLVRRAVRQGMGFGRALGRPAEAAIAAAEAVLLPIIAASSTDAPIVAIARPPRTWPIHA